MIEGEIIKKRAKEQIEEDKQKEIEKHKKIDQMNKEFIDANTELEKIKEKKSKK